MAPSVLGTELRPIFALQNLIFRFLQSRQKVQIWLFEQTDLRIEGRIIVSQPHSLVQPQDGFAVPDLIRSPFVLCELLRHVQGFDEYMNLVLDEAEEVSMKRKTRKALGEALATSLPLHSEAALLAWQECAAPRSLH